MKIQNDISGFCCLMANLYIKAMPPLELNLVLSVFGWSMLLLQLSLQERSSLCLLLSSGGLTDGALALARTEERALAMDVLAIFVAQRRTGAREASRW